LYTSRGLTAAKLLVTLSSLFVLHLSSNYLREHTRHALEFSIIILIATFFLLLHLGSNNLMLTFFSLAGFSLNMYILILYDVADAASREAALKYFYLSALSAGLILGGILLIYLMYGNVNYGMLRFLSTDDYNLHRRTVVSAAVLFVSLGFFFKLSAFPAHL
jgi:NADH:ubiquinone oxidoreductase subunit 2 (subunit N)